MSQDSEEFKALRQLLALKRHEQPPPGYFNDFSGQVVARIKAGDRVDDTLAARLLWEAPWLQRIWGALEANPVLVGVFGATVCGLLVWGVTFSEKADVWSIVDAVQGQVQPVGALAKSGPAGGSTRLVASESASDEPLLAEPTMATSMEGSLPGKSLAVAEPAPGVFDLIPKPKAESASATLRLDLGPRN